MDKSLTVVEAQAGGRRYYRAYVAETLDGQWAPLATANDEPFVGPASTEHTGARRTDSFSHVELIRDGYDRNLVADPSKLSFLFQGAGDEQKKRKKYGEIPWRLGMLIRAQ